MGNKFTKGAKFRHGHYDSTRHDHEATNTTNNTSSSQPTSPTMSNQYRIVSTDEIQTSSSSLSTSSPNHHQNTIMAPSSTDQHRSSTRKSSGGRLRSLSTTTTTPTNNIVASHGGNGSGSGSGGSNNNNNHRTSPGSSPSLHQRFLLLNGNNNQQQQQHTNNHNTTIITQNITHNVNSVANSPTVRKNKSFRSVFSGVGNNSRSSNKKTNKANMSNTNGKKQHHTDGQPQLQLNDSNLNNSSSKSNKAHSRTSSNGSISGHHYPLLSTSSTGMIQNGHFHRKTSSQPPPNWNSNQYQNSGSLLSPNGTGNPLVSLQMSPSPSSWQNNYFIYNYSILSSSAPQATINRSLSSSPMSVSSAASSISNSRDQLVEYQLMEFSPQQRLVHEKLRAMFPSMKNVPDYFLAYFSLVLSDEVTLRETIFSNVNDISFYLEMQSKIEELFLEEDERLGKSPSTSKLDHFTPKSPAYHSFTNDNVLVNTTEDGDVNYSVNYLVNSNDANENITSNLNLNDSYSSISTTEKVDISSSIINDQLDFLNPFHIMSRSELTIRLIILPKIVKNVFYAKTEVAQLISPVFSTRNNLHFRDAFTLNDEFTVCVVVGFWVLEYIPSSGIIVPKLIYGPSELFSYVQSIPVIATLNNSDGHAMSALISTIIKWNCEKKNPNSNAMTFIDDLFKTLHVNTKYSSNSTLENWRNGNSTLEWTIPNHYNLLKTPTLKLDTSRVLKFKSIEDYESSVPQIIHTLSSEMLISNGGIFDYLSCLQKCFS